jgi:hypothetical protein
VNQSMLIFGTENGLRLIATFLGLDRPKEKLLWTHVYCISNTSIDAVDNLSDAEKKLPGINSYAIA